MHRQHENGSLGRTAVPCLLALALIGAIACGDAPLKFAISFPAARSAQPLDGRVLLLILDFGTNEPRTQTDQYRAFNTRPIFGIDVDGLKPGQDAIIDNSVFGFPARSLKDIPPGDYWVQALLNKYETFKRADGHTVQVKHISLPNDRLTKFWGRPMSLGAIVLLPFGWDTHPNAHYPLVIHHGHFPKDMAGDGWRETPPDPTAEGQGKTEQELRYQFYKDWNGPNFPRMIHVLVQHANPYFDDSYAVNSVNVGPYGDAITYDLIPYIEKQFRGIGQGWARAMTGGSTGGWETLGAQVFYPDEYNGAWASCPDPGDFRAYRSVNIYDEKNAHYYDDNPWKHTARPAYRDSLGRIYSTFEDRDHVELALGTHGRSAGQGDIWPAVFGPLGDDGYYKPLYDKLTGVIDPEVAKYWKEHYDLRYVMQRDWATLGPKLRGKIHITIGTMDNGYLNNAVYYMDEFLKNAKNPPSDADVVYGDRYEHCWTGDPKHPNWYGRLTVHQRYLPLMAAWMKKTAPAVADTRSWVY